MLRQLYGHSLHLSLVDGGRCVEPDGVFGAGGRVSELSGVREEEDKEGGGGLQ